MIRRCQKQGIVKAAEIAVILRQYSFKNAPTRESAAALPDDLESSFAATESSVPILGDAVTMI